MKLSIDVPVIPADHFNKFIVSHSWGNNPTHDEYRHGNAFILPNHYDHSLISYLQMFLVAKEVFPNLDYDDCHCTTVTKSAWCKGMPILRFSCEKPDMQFPGWTNCENKLPDVVYEV